MYNEEGLRTFLNNSDKRISNMLDRSSKMRYTSYFEDAAKDLESKVKDSKIHFYGTRIFMCGHEKSHLNMFMEVGEKTS